MSAFPQKQILPNGLVVLTAGKRSDFFPAELLYAGVGLRPVALALLDSRVHVDAGVKPNLFRPASSSDNFPLISAAGKRSRFF
jgi:hypothetical protein